MLFRLSRRRGQGTVELAFALPIFLLFILAIFDLARTFHTWSSLSHQVESATRLATRRQYSLIRGAYGSSTHTPLSEVVNRFHQLRSPWVPSTWISSPAITGVGDSSQEVIISATATVPLITPGFGFLFGKNEYQMTCTARERKE